MDSLTKQKADIFLSACMSNLILMDAFYSGFEQVGQSLMLHF